MSAMGGAGEAADDRADERQNRRAASASRRRASRRGRRSPRRPQGCRPCRRPGRRARRTAPSRPCRSRDRAPPARARWPGGPAWRSSALSARSRPAIVRRQQRQDGLAVGRHTTVFAHSRPRTWAAALFLGGERDVVWIGVKDMPCGLRTLDRRRNRRLLRARAEPAPGRPAGRGGPEHSSTIGAR